MHSLSTRQAHAVWVNACYKWTCIHIIIIIRYIYAILSMCIAVWFPYLKYFFVLCHTASRVCPNATTCYCSYLYLGYKINSQSVPRVKNISFRSVCNQIRIGYMAGHLITSTRYRQIFQILYCAKCNRSYIPSCTASRRFFRAFGTCINFFEFHLSPISDRECIFVFYHTCYLNLINAWLFNILNSF